MPSEEDVESTAKNEGKGEVAPSLTNVNRLATGSNEADNVKDSTEILGGTENEASWSTREDEETEGSSHIQRRERKEEEEEGSGVLLNGEREKENNEFGFPFGERQEKLETLKTRERKRILSVVDAILSVAIIGPLTIGFWKGTWSSMDRHGNIFPWWLYFFGGTIFHFISAMTKHRLHEMAEEFSAKDIMNRAKYRAIRLLYVYVFGVFCNAQWRGGWMIFDYFTALLVWKIVWLCASLGALIGLRSVRNIIAPPFIVVIDTLDYSFKFPTRYKTNTRNWSLYVLDCAVSVGVVGTLVVFVWRGVWVLFDIYLFPKNPEYSALGSIIIGYATVTLTFTLQPAMRYACARLRGLPLLAVADAFIILSFLGTVNVWRGIWNILDLWLLPDSPELSNWITHIGCFVFLVLLNCSNSVLVRGVYIDAEEDEGKCVVFPCHYLRLFFKIEREKKETRRRNLTVASRDTSRGTDTANVKEAENGALLNSTASPIPHGNPESLV